MRYCDQAVYAYQQSGVHIDKSVVYRKRKEIQGSVPRIEQIYAETSYF